MSRASAPTHGALLARRAEVIRLRATGMKWEAIAARVGLPSRTAAVLDWQRARNTNVLDELQAARAAMVIVVLLPALERTDRSPIEESS